MGVDDLLVGFDGLDGAAGDAAELVGAEPGCLLHELASTTWRCSSLTAVGQLTGGPDDHRGVVRGDEPGVQSLGGGVVAGVELAGECDLSGRVRARGVVVLASQASAPVNPASFATSA